MMLLIFLTLLILAVLGGSLYAYRVAFYASKKGRTNDPTFHGKHCQPYQQTIRRLYERAAGLDWEDVTIVSWDGLRLRGHYCHYADNAPLVLCFHGYRSFGLKDFCGGIDLSRKMGHNILMVDQRAHGESQGDTISFGVKERFDVVNWVNYAVTRFGPETKIMLYGVSMGGGTVLMASGLDLAENVKGIIADCPFDSPIRILLHVAGRTGIPDWVNRPLLVIGAAVFGGFNVLGADAAEAVKHTKVPILIIHGEADHFVPAEMSKRVYEANPSMITRMTVPGADHGISFLLDPEGYEKAVRTFAEKVKMQE